MNIRTSTFTIAALFLLACLGIGVASAEPNMEEAVKFHRIGDPYELKGSIDTVIANAANVDPMQLAILSAKLHDLHRFDEGLFWYFVAVNRLGVVSTIAPDSVRAQDPGGLLMALSYGYYAGLGCDPKHALAILDRAIAWDKDTPLSLVAYESQAKVSKADWPAVIEKQRKGLLDIRRNLVNAQPVQQFCAIAR